MQFLCPTCQSTLALPDDSLGKKAQCPSCQAVFRVPETAGSSDRSPTNLTDAIIRPDRTDAVACPGCDRLLAFHSHSAGQAVICPSCQRRVRMPTASEMTGLQPQPNTSMPSVASRSRTIDGVTETVPQRNPFAGMSDQPYAAPPISSETYRPTTATNYAAPGWALFGISAANLGYDLLWIGIIVLSMIAEKLDADAIAGFAVFIVWGVISIALHALSLIAGLRITQQRSLSIARLGSVLGLAPCGICGIIQLPFAIWALVVVYSAKASADFSD